MFDTLNKINTAAPPTIVHLGSIVYTTLANYFIAISAGKLDVDGVTFYAISSITPIGKLLMSKKIGEEITFRGQKFTIENVL